MQCCRESLVTTIKVFSHLLTDHIDQNYVFSQVLLYFLELLLYSFYFLVGEVYCLLVRHVYVHIGADVHLNLFGPVPDRFQKDILAHLRKLMLVVYRQLPDQILKLAFPLFQLVAV